jgi:hypothetical protein
MLSKRSSHAALWILMAYFTKAAVAQPQPFSSGSTGADGALSYNTPGTYYFNPGTLHINASGSNIFNFTTINIASGVTLIFTSQILTGPMYWLASGDVNISGTLSLDGAVGHSRSNNASDRIPSAAGAGGFGGGVGGGGSLLPSAGNGPGGGAGATVKIGNNGTFTGGLYLVPLIGGSGGGGSLNGDPCETTYGDGGGAGGGAILIASSTTINLNGGSSISVRGGGPECFGGGGSGGAIRLVANTVTAPSGTGTPPQLYATGAGYGAVSNGRIRVEAFTGNNSAAYINYNGAAVSFSVPFALALPATAPAVIKVTSINGIPINANPFSFPDAIINTNGPITLNVQAQYIPVGTIPKIYVYGESGPDQTITCSALAGTLPLSTCSASIAFVVGGSHGFAKATW